MMMVTRLQKQIEWKDTNMSVQEIMMQQELELHQKNTNPGHLELQIKMWQHNYKQKNMTTLYTSKVTKVNIIKEQA